MSSELAANSFLAFYWDIPAASARYPSYQDTITLILTHILAWHPKLISSNLSSETILQLPHHLPFSHQLTQFRVRLCLQLEMVLCYLNSFSSVTEWTNRSQDLSSAWDPAVPLLSPEYKAQNTATREVLEGRETAKRDRLVPKHLNFVHSLSFY